MLDRRDVLEIVGRPGASVQEFVGDFLWRITSQSWVGACWLWQQAWGAWAYVIAIIVLAAISTVSSDTLTLWFSTPEKFRDMVSVLVAPAAVVTLVLLARRTNALERQVTLSESGLITERYSRAVELLGHIDPGVRMGAVYALERLSKDSDSDYATVIEVLAAFVRHNAPRSSVKDSEETRLPVDIDAAVKVLLRRSRSSRFDRPIDLRNTNLDGLDISSANFRGLDLAGASLRCSRLYGANLDNAYLFGTDFTRASIDGASLSDAYISGADFTRASLYDVDVSQADFYEANLTQADLENVNGLTQKQVNEVLFDPALPPINAPKGIELPDMSDAWARSQWTNRPEGSVQSGAP